MTPSTPFEELLMQSQGKPFVYDHNDMRSLHFDAKFVQSMMSITAPDKLLLRYTRAMMAFLLFQRQPRHILLVGLGGGSLAKFCYRNFPAARITVLELSAEVIALRDAFLIPPDDERFQVIHADAAAYLMENRQDGKRIDRQADVILLDGFTADGLAPELSTRDFYLACSRWLTEDGVLVSNLWSSPTSYAVVTSPVEEEFAWSVWWCKTYDSHNYISFFVKGGNRTVLRPVLVSRARKLDQEFDLDLSGLVGSLQMVDKKKAGKRKG
ncbi:MAG: transferase spermidine synthase [Pseudomonadota bacterium]